MHDWLCVIMLMGGLLFSLIASVGLLRMPDVFMRMAASTKAGTLGSGLLLVSVAIYFQDIEVTTKILAAIAFFFITAPVGAHMISRAAYCVGVKIWEGNVRDDLKGRYDLKNKNLS